MFTLHMFLHALPRVLFASKGSWYFFPVVESGTLLKFAFNEASSYTCTCNMLHYSSVESIHEDFVMYLKVKM